MTIKRIGSLAAAAAACLVFSPSFSRGGLFADFSYYHTLSVSQIGNPPVVTGGTLSGSAASLPLQQTLSASLPNVSASATYAFADDGTTATYRVDCQAQITQSNHRADEGTGSATLPADELTFAQPVTYVATLTSTGGGGIDFQFMTPDLSHFFFNGSGTFTHTGTVPAGELVDILEDWEIENLTPTSPAVVSGTESLSIVFTAVPEPASAAGVAVIGAALLARRRRPAGRC